jgi:DUF4097 and DUF4098 domain-containing protein YvlB
MKRHVIVFAVVVGSLWSPALVAQSRDPDRVRIRTREVARVVERVNREVTAQSTSDDPCRDRQWDAETFCEVRESTMPAGPLTVDAGRNGGVQVTGWDRNEIRVRAVVNAHAPTQSDARQLAGGVQVQAGSGRVTSSGPTTDREEWWSVSFRIDVPRRTDLDLSANNGGISITAVNGTLRFATSNGGVRLQDVAGDVRGETRNGGVSVTLGGTRWEGAGLDVTTTNGGVTLSIPDGYNAALTTRTVNGTFRSDYPITLQGELSPRRGISTTLGSGGAPVSVRTTNGGLKINRR